MKSFIQLFILTFIFAFFLESCTKEFLEIEPVDRLTADNFFKTEGEIKAATAALYGFPWFDYNDKFAWCAGDCMSGDLYHTWDQEGQFFYFSFNSGNAHLSSGWKGLFRVVSYANSIINDMPRAAEGNVEQEVIDRALGEARFIRGMAYYLLSEYWGEVPIVENSTEIVVSNNFILPKNTRASVLEFIRRDLEFASQHLPTTDEPGRVTKWSALGMLAKVHLTMASDLDDSKSAENFQLAKQFAEQVISSSGLQLLPDYSDIFRYDHNNNEESLFALQWMEGAYAIGNSRQANWARSSLVTGNTEAWGGGKCMTYDFLQKVEGGDRRQPAIYMTQGDHYPEIRKNEGGYTYNIVHRDPNDPNTVLENAAPVLNNLKKYIIGSNEDTDGNVSTGQATRINQILLRLADVYMVYAEAELGAQVATSDPKALQYFNAIRERAGLPTKSSLTFADILKERRVEFALEDISWFDIKRYYYRDPAGAMAYLNGMEREISYYRDNGPNAADENTIEGYIINPPSNPITINESQLWLPIPSAEVVANPLLAPEVPAEEYIFK
ncbi:MAG TPA: RagB/SusD family nutrient uptake outer membrane protein [Saprospiraceae bacterium]|nr:RagB/SusD family nutrient uptake outer membrane protein [Saprospiraceae bacterium]HMQ81410.1 RagB/SusD family nutrient uptake outer membrane protein [Saprospiraceae bacterium]